MYIGLNIVGCFRPPDFFFFLIHGWMLNRNTPYMSILNLVSILRWFKNWKYHGLKN